MQSASASRLAGSMLSTATFCPRAASPSASAAEMLVLPTPPAPAQMQMRLPSRRSGRVRLRAGIGLIVGEAPNRMLS